MESQIKLLTYSGILPFLFALLAFIFEIEEGFALKAVLAYSAVIASFIAGLHFMLYLLKSEDLRINLLFLSNIFALLAWVSLLLSKAEFAFILLILCFLGLYSVEKQFKSLQLWPQWFHALRLKATLSVVTLLALFLAVV
jgi:Protein of unknown function (DUF3429)